MTIFSKYSFPKEYLQFGSMVLNFRA
uniref:Uncharacterized protein n=1 Tax=Anguilla anguilla TaxID=7936 RepID=A0A0E9PZ83_ANGAN